MFSPRLKNSLQTPFPELHKLTALMDEAEADVLASWASLRSTGPDTLDQLPEAHQCRDQATHRYRRNFPDDAATGSAAPFCSSRTSDWAIRRARYMTLKPSFDE
jgi:hypothetical protein